MIQHLSEFNHNNFSSASKKVEKILFERSLHCTQIYECISFMHSFEFRHHQLHVYSNKNTYYSKILLTVDKRQHG